MGGIKIFGLGHYVPNDTLTNDDLSKMIDTNDEWIYTRTGMKTRHISKDENTSELSYQAAKFAIAESGIALSEIGYIVVATSSADYIIPSVAAILRGRLDIPKERQVFAVDVNAACSGFAYGFEVANALAAARPNEYGLLVGADVMSKVMDYTDRSTCILFADGAGAAVIKYDPNAVYYSVMNCDTDIDALFVPGLPLGDADEPSYMKMKGQEVFKFAAERVPESINQVLDKAGLTMDDIDWFVCHQANQRIIASVCKRLHGDMNRFFSNIDRYANTSAGSIPIALHEMQESGLLKKGMKVILSGFGSGLTWGTILMEW